MAFRMSDIVTREVTASQIEQAKEIRADRDKKYSNIYEEKESDMRWVGDLGEIVINEMLLMCSPHNTDWHKDENVTGMPDFTFLGKTMDVKTVKRKVPMKTDYMAQITAKHIRTPMDYILFTCYEFPKKKLHVLGIMKKSEFLDKAIYFGEGDKVHENYQIRKGHEIYAVYVNQMTPIREFLTDILTEKGILKKVA